MPNIGSLLKEEIARVARKQLRGETQALKKAVAHYRGQIAQLRRRMQALEQEIGRVRRSATGRGRAVAAAEESGEEGKGLRFSAKGLAQHRKRLGLSAAAAGKLMGVSALSVYKWENGQTRPRAKQIQAIAALRQLGKREAAAKLAELG